MSAHVPTLTEHAPLKPITRHALHCLRAHPGGLTTNEARALGCGDRFAARVFELRRAFGDTAITDTWETHGEARFKRFHWTQNVDPQTGLFDL